MKISRNTQLIPPRPILKNDRVLDKLRNYSSELMFSMLNKQIKAMLQTQKRPVHIYMEANPNPNSLKFVLNFMLAEDGSSFDFPTVESAENSALARELFNFAAVER